MSFNAKNLLICTAIGVSLGFVYGWIEDKYMPKNTEEKDVPEVEPTE